MAAWIPVLKAVLPPLANIVTSTVPAFTARKNGVTAQQITELQAAARQNSAATIELAEKLKTTVEAIEAGAIAQDRALRQLRIACLVAVVLAGLALAMSLSLLL